MTRRLRYQVATSLDGFIAGPNGEYDWIVMDPAIDFAALYREFDTAVMGRKTYEAVAEGGYIGTMSGIDVIVFSRTLAPGAANDVRIVGDDPATVVRELKSKPGRDIWLYGGGELFRSLLDAGLVDTVEVAVMPVVLGQGVPLLPPGATQKLALAHHRVLPGSGIAILAYAVEGSTADAPPIRWVSEGKSPTIATKASIPNPQLAALGPIIGEWTTTGSHGLMPGQTLRGRARCEWLEGGAFLMMRAEIDHPQFPGGVSIIGSDDETGALTMLYFDERGVSRRYDAELRGKTLSWSRRATALSQRYSLTFSADGSSLEGSGEMSRHGGAWEPDLSLRYSRVK